MSINIPLINNEDIRSYRSRWKPIKQVLVQGDQIQQDTHIRFHRACSWLQSASSMDTTEQTDEILMLMWVAFNSLYGTWNMDDQCPDPDVKSWQDFICRMVKLDNNAVFAKMLTGNRGLVNKLLEDEYLSKYFWEDPTDERANQSRKAMYNARTWYQCKKWSLILIAVLDRVYMMRCQLTHGAATHGSQLNRESLETCIMMMDCIMRSVLEVWIACAEDHDWGEMCYPPME